jgi:hypothetical protein
MEVDEDEGGEGNNPDFPAVEERQHAEDPHPRADMDDLARQVSGQSGKAVQRFAGQQQSDSVSIRNAKTNPLTRGH